VPVKRCAGPQGALLTRITADAGPPHDLMPIEQAYVLAVAKQSRKGEAQDSLSGWRLAPFVEAIHAQPLSCWACQLAERLITARHESQRPRVRERALLAFQTLRDSLQACSLILPSADNTYLVSRGPVDFQKL
jgi:hypothetical protein